MIAGKGTGRRGLMADAVLDVVEESEAEDHDQGYGQGDHLNEERSLQTPAELLDTNGASRFKENSDPAINLAAKAEENTKEARCDEREKYDYVQRVEHA